MSKEKNGVFHVGIGRNRYRKTYIFIGWTRYLFLPIPTFSTNPDLHIDIDGILDIEKNTMSKEKNGVFHVRLGRNRYQKTNKFIGWTYSQPLIFCSQVAHLQGLNFISRNQYEITKSTAKKIFAPLEGIFALLVQKTLPEVQEFQLFGNL